MCEFDKICIMTHSEIMGPWVPDDDVIVIFMSVYIGSLWI